MPSIDPDAVPDPRGRHWSQLEQVRTCPVCGESERELVHANLWDNIFFTAPGSWTIWRCLACRSGFLDPRPDRETIGLAYGRYFTHEEPLPSAPSISAAQRFRGAIGNSYRNRRYEANLQPTVAGGYWITRALPWRRRVIDQSFRFLPSGKTASPPKVLDVGCGNGGWLVWAREIGWHVCGADPDPVAVAVARRQGIDIREGGIEAWSDSGATFDAITMSHVIEHVHDPAAVLAEAFSLLKPGGQLYVETPNVEALGHAVYGRHWYGLDPPRHLILFSRKSLVQLLLKAGFTDLKFRRIESPLVPLAVQGVQLAATEGKEVPLPGLWLRARSAFSRRHCEFLTLTCRRGP